MRSKSSKVRTVLAAALAGMLLAAVDVGGSAPAAAQFRMGGFGHTGGLAGRGAGFGRAGGPALARSRGRIVERAHGMGRRPPRFGRSGIWARHRVVRIETDRERPALVAGRSGVGGGPAGFGGGALPRGEARYVPDQVIVQFATSASPAAIGRLARRFDLTELEARDFRLIGRTLSLWRIGGGRSVMSMVGSLQYQTIIARVEPNYIFALQGQTAAVHAHGDPAQYVLSKLQVEEAQRIATGANVMVAVIDTGIDARHPDLGGSIVRNFDALSGNDAPQLHGTEMAGAIASHGRLLGIAPGVELLAACAFDGRSGGTSFAIYKSLQWAADNGARVINMSFAGPPDPTLRRMLAAAAGKNIVLVAAAGNAGSNSPPLYPAADANVIAVTATDAEDRVFAMANRGSYIAIAAPGVDVLALAPSDAYQITTGTSVAAAHVSGIAALLLQHDPSLTPADIRRILIDTAKPIGASGAEAGPVPGLVDAYRALTASLKTTGTEAAREQAGQ